MLQRNSASFIPDFMHRIPAVLCNGRVLLAISFAFLILASSCKKIRAAAGSRSDMEALFEENILNKNFVVHFASDNGTNITSQFTGYNFILTRTTSFYEGPMTGTKGSVTYSGTWTSNDDYSKLVINLNTPTAPPEFSFINRSWKFTKKGIPIMELAPWGSTEPKVLHMMRL
jgi:hypothetical protein